MKQTIPTSTTAMSELATKLCDSRSLSVDEYAQLIEKRTAADREGLARFANGECERVYGDAVYVRALIEFTNHCKNDCLYCGIRRSNRSCRRFRLKAGQIRECADVGYERGFRTFVLQGGEDTAMTDDVLCAIVSELKSAHPDCAVTLSVGERSRESYRRLREAGADRYLLRHETASPAHYARLHPRSMSFKRRMCCLEDLRELGYVVGTGFMVGSPYQTPADLAADLKFIERFEPDMCGIGPFIPHHATPFASFAAGTPELTCFLLSIIRIVKPDVLLPATTALGTADGAGYEKGVRSGANVVMPNFSPADVRADYELYDGKVCSDGGSPAQFEALRARMASVGRRIVVDRGDPKRIGVQGAYAGSLREAQGLSGKGVVA